MSGHRLRLVFHIGAGKTGTSSVQETLRANREALKSNGVWYLGLMLEHAPVLRHGWQRASGSEAFLGLAPDDRRDGVVAVLRESVDAIVASGCHTAVWSNEWFFRAATVEMIEAMRALGAADVDVQVVAYVRRHDAWARSAYAQWGLRHKTYEGPILPFDAWVAKRSQEFAPVLERWRDALGNRLMVRNYDAAGDVVADFLRVAGVDPDVLAPVRSNETPSAEELFLRAVFNEDAAGPRPPVEFDRSVPRLVRPRLAGAPAQVLAGLLPDAGALARVARRNAGDRAATDALLAACGQPPLPTSPLEDRAVQVDLGALVTMLAQVAMDQARRLHHLERRLSPQRPARADGSPGSAIAPAAPTDPAAGAPARPGASLPGGHPSTAFPGRDAPVFLLSTGRTGSTLLQRLLNCHPGLVVWGEHHGFLGGLAGTFADMSGQRRRLLPATAADNTGPAILLPTLTDPDAPIEWANPWSSAEYEARLREFIDGYFGSRLPEGVRWGFKEILYNRIDVLAMLHRLFPRGRFVFMTRDPCEVVRSKIFAFEKAENWARRTPQAQDGLIVDMLRQVGGHFDAYREFSALAPGACLTVAYERLVAATDATMREVLRFAGLDAGAYDWALARSVGSSILTPTPRDDALRARIAAIAAAEGIPVG